MHGIQAGGYIAAAACRGVWSKRFLLPADFAMPGVSFQSLADGVTHPIKSLPDVRRTDPRSTEIERCKGVAAIFHVSPYSIEPSVSIRRSNLLAKHDWRLALADEPGELRPEVAFVCCAFAFACTAERLAGATSCPNRPVGGPSCELQGEAPSSDPCEEVALGVSVEVFWLHIYNAPFVYGSCRDQTGLDEFTQPGGCFLVVLVVVVHNLPRPR